MSVSIYELPHMEARSSPNSSHSKIHLTRGNYRGPPLLKNIRNRNQLSTPMQEVSAPLPNMAAQDEEDYARPPESSSEEEAKGPSNIHKSHSAKRKREPAKPTRTSKRKKLEDSPGLSPLPPKAQEHPQSSLPNRLDLLSQSQPSQKKRPTYANRKKAKITDEPPEAISLTQKRSVFEVDDFDAHGIEERQANVPQKTRNFNTEEECSPIKQVHPQKPVSRLDVLQQDQDGPASSASSVNTLTRFFEETPEPEEPSKKALVLSSPPTSPEVIGVDETSPDSPQPTVEHSTISCPVCHQDVDRSRTLPSEKHPRLLSLAKQQAFCRRHRLNDAHNLLKQRDYPNVDWEVLTLERIPKYVEHLQGILNGKVKCYYADQLSTAITKAKGGRRVIRDYLTEGVLDIVKPGYYGPKGSTVMMGQIISRMSKDINSKLEDKLMRAAGMGNYVAAVLVPELTLRLVMEDLSIKSEAEGRRVLDESTGVGLLLNPDDDHVD